MYKYYALAVLLYFCVITPISQIYSKYQAHQAQETLTVPWYSMRINFPATFKKIPVLCGYYKGYKLEFDENLCIIPENNQACSYFTVIITEQVQHINDGTLEHLTRLADKPCRLFHVSRRDKQWHVQEELTDNIPLRLPEEALVLLINPLFIEDFKAQESTRLEIPIITLPTLYIKSTVTQQEFDITALRALFASLDVNPVHSSVKKTVKKERSLVISLRTPA
jgi:hypothetical protein